MSYQRRFPLVPPDVEDHARVRGTSLIADGYRLEAIHAYTHPDGSPWWYVARWKNPLTKEKRPLPFFRGEDGRFENKQPTFGGKLPLYHLDKLHQYPFDVVVLVEGEGCADWLEAPGFISSTWPNGAQAVDRVDFGPLAGRVVTLWPDFDVPGQAAMEKVRAILHRLGCDVLVVDVAALGLSPKGDCVDWLERIGGAYPADGQLPSLPLVQNTDVAVAA